MPQESDVENEPPSDRGKIRRLLDEDIVRKTIASPRDIPRRMREEITEILAEELISGYDVRDIWKFTGRYGAFYPVLATLKQSDEWKKLKELAERGHLASSIVMKSLLPLVLDLIEKFLKQPSAAEKELGEKSKMILDEFKRIIEETIELWGRRAVRPGPKDWAAINQRLEKLLAEDTKMSIMERIRAGIQGALPGLASKIKEEIEAMETLALLFPGRLWDFAMMDLYKTLLANIESYAKLLETSSDLKRILDMLGRIELEYGARRIQVTNYGASEVYSVRTSKDIQYILPMELLKLGDDTLKYLFLAQFVEGKLLTYQLRGRNWAGGPPKKKRRGPVVALVDTSGSMHGAPELTAKAVVLSITKKMLKEKRDVKVILFSSTDQAKEIEMTQRSRMAAEFLDFMRYSFGGGTDFNTALKFGVSALREKKWASADLLFITDGLSKISDQSMLKDWGSLKRSNDARAYSIIVGNDDPGGLTAISDETYLLRGINDWELEHSPARIIKVIK